MRQQDLLAAISKLQPVRVVGRFERHTSLRWEELKGSAAGGRWGARRAFEVLYLGRPRDSVVVEAYRHLVEDELDDPQALAATVLERRLLTIEVKVPNILDLREEANGTGLERCAALLRRRRLQSVPGSRRRSARHRPSWSDRTGRHPDRRDAQPLHSQPREHGLSQSD